MAFELALLDNCLPGMTGLQAIPLLAAKGTRDVVLMTGHPSPETFSDALLIGARLCLAKPFDLAALEAQLRRLLEEPRP